MGGPDGELLVQSHDHNALVVGPRGVVYVGSGGEDTRNMRDHILEEHGHHLVGGVKIPSTPLR